MSCSNEEEFQRSNDRDSQSEGEEEEEEDDEEDEEDEEDDVLEFDDESLGDADGEEDEDEISGEVAEDALYSFGLPTNPASSSNLNSNASQPPQDSCACHHCQAPPCTENLVSV